MFNWNSQNSQATPFFDDNYQKPSIFQPEVNEEFNAYDLFNGSGNKVYDFETNFCKDIIYGSEAQLEQQASMKDSKGKESKKSLIQQLSQEPFDKNEAFSNLEQKFRRQEMETTNCHDKNSLSESIVKVYDFPKSLNQNKKNQNNFGLFRKSNEVSKNFLLNSQKFEQEFSFKDDQKLSKQKTQQPQKIQIKNSFLPKFSRRQSRNFNDSFKTKSSENFAQIHNVNKIGKLGQNDTKVQELSAAEEENSKLQQSKKSFKGFSFSLAPDVNQKKQKIVLEQPKLFLENTSKQNQLRSSRCGNFPTFVPNFNNFLKKSEVKDFNFKNDLSDESKRPQNQNDLRSSRVKNPFEFKFASAAQKKENKTFTLKKSDQEEKKSSVILPAALKTEKTAIQQPMKNVKEPFQERAFNKQKELKEKIKPVEPKVKQSFQMNVEQQQNNGLMNKLKQKPRFNLKALKQKQFKGEKTSFQIQPQFKEKANHQNINQKNSLNSSREIKQQINKRENIPTVQILKKNDNLFQRTKNFSFGNKTSEEDSKQNTFTEASENKQSKQILRTEMKLSFPVASKSKSNQEDKTPKVIKIDVKNSKNLNSRSTQKLNDLLNEQVTEQSIESSYLEKWKIDYQFYENQLNLLSDEFEVTKKKSMKNDDSNRGTFLLLNKANMILSTSFMSQTQHSDHNNKNKIGNKNQNKFAK